MWKQTLFAVAGATTRRSLSTAASTSTSTSTSYTAKTAIDSLILRSLKEHYLELSKMSPPPKVNPPEPYTIIKGALDRDWPVLRREYKGEEISISVMRLSNIIPAGADDEDGDNNDVINQLFLHVDVSKPGWDEGLHFLCGLYPDAIGIHSVCLRPKDEDSRSKSLIKYQGRVFQELDQKLRDGFHTFIEARGVNEKLFPFLQAWLYVKDHRNLMHWFKRVGVFVKGSKTT